MGGRAGSWEWRENESYRLGLLSLTSGGEVTARLPFCPPHPVQAAAERAFTSLQIVAGEGAEEFFSSSLPTVPPRFAREKTRHAGSLDLRRGAASYADSSPIWWLHSRLDKRFSS